MSFNKLTLSFFLFLISSITFADNVPYKTAKDGGIKKCLSSIKEITHHLIKDDAHGAYSVWNSARPDVNSFSTTIERNFTDGVMLSNVVVSPVLSGDCAVTYNQVFFVEKSCMAVRSKDFPQLEYKGELVKEVTILADSIMKVFLMQVKGGCVVVKKEDFNAKIKKG